MLKMFGLSFTICVLTFISLSFDSALCKICEPDFRPHHDDVLYEPAQQILVCSIRRQTACINNMEYILYQKYFEPQWSTVATINSSDILTTPELPNGYSLTNRSNAHNISNEYRLSIVPTQIDDSGNWRCVVQQYDGGLSESDIGEVKIARNLSKENIIITIPPEIVLGTPASYSCRSDGVYPKATVEWNINENPENGSTQFIPNGIAVDIVSNVNYTFNNRNIIDVKCVFDREDLDPPRGAEAGVVADVYAPASIVNSTLPNPTPVLTETLKLSCTASGTNAKINWLHKGDPLNMSLFKQSIVNITGDYQFGEKTATNSTLTWILPPQPTCENVAAHHGEYTCTSQAARGGQVSQIVGTVDVRYSPLLKTEPSCDINATVGDIVQIEVKTCSNPTATYAWKSKDGHHDVGAENGESVEFRVQDNDTIICNVSNPHDNLVTYCIIFAIDTELETTPTDQYTTPVYSTTVDPGEPKSPNQALVTAFAVIWSLCGVFAILLICLALYHYRQIQNGKKYKGEYSEELVLTEDEAAPGTSHGSGVYDDINPAVVAKGSMDEAVGGISNEGLYAEVQRSAQTQMPISPKRASKIPASQPNPGTPKTKRNQAPAAPKSPINTRHEPNSPPTDRRPEPKADYSPVSMRKEIKPQHSNESNRGPVSKTDQHQKRHKSPNKTEAVKQTTNGAKPTIPFKPNITSVRSSRSSAAGAPYDNAEVNLYANCDQRPVKKNDDGTITYADLDLQKEDPYDDGAPSVPAKNMNDQEPVQYASIKHGK